MYAAMKKMSQGLAGRIERFAGEPASPRPLAVLRIGLAAVLLLQAFLVAGGLHDLYGNRGYVQWSVLDPEQGGSPVPAAAPRIRWLSELLTDFGVSDAACVQIVFVAYVTSLSALLVGWRSRAAAILTWFLHLAMMNSATASIYGVDSFAHIALFYCMFAPVGSAWSLDVASGRASDEPSAAARLSLRALQLHLCVVYLASGIEKATGSQWWDGEAIWRAVMRPDLAQFDLSWLASAPWVAKALVWSTLFLEIGYALLIWPRWTRKLTAVSTVGLHLGIGVVLGLVTFSALMSVLNVAAFLVPAEPRSVPATDHSPVTTPMVSRQVVGNSRRRRAGASCA